MNADTIHKKHLLEAARDVARYLSLAQTIESKQYPEGNAPGDLLPAILLSLAVRHGTNEIMGAIDDLPYKIDISGIVIDRLAGIETELFKIAERLAGHRS